MKAAVFCFSDSGAKLAERLCTLLDLKKECLHRHIPDDIGDLFAEKEALIFIGACGIAVRIIAPFVKSKMTDPAVIVIDDQGRYVIPVLSGHIGGANDIARKLASLLGATPVITTATDGAGKFSCDAWAVQNNCAISSIEVAKNVSAAILKNDIPVASDYELPSPLPKGLVKGESGEIGIYIGIHGRSPFKATLQLIPRILTLGIGCRKGTGKEQLMSAIKTVLADNDLDFRAVGKIVSIDIKKDEEGLISCAKALCAETAFYTADELSAAEGDFSESEFVRKTVGTGNVCERSAAISGGKMIVRKTALDGITVAVAVKDWRVEF